MIYNKTVQHCFFSPRHIGMLDLAHNLTVMVENKQKRQGVIHLYIRCNSEGMIDEICFKTNGNPFLIAGLEWLSEQLEHKLIDKVLQIEYQLIINELNLPVSQYPLALRLVALFKESALLMKTRLAQEVQHS